MSRLTVEQDVSLGSALDQLDDAIEAAHPSLKMARWAQLNVARYVGRILGSDLNEEIRAVPLDIERLWGCRKSRENSMLNTRGRLSNS